MCWQLSLTITDSKGADLSESTVYRVLKKAGLIKWSEIIGFKAANEYPCKTKRPNELWASDCCHLGVIDWSWYYLVSIIMDDYSRFILAWDLKVDISGGSLEDVVQQAVDLTGMTNVPLENRTVLLSDNGASYISQQFNEYLRVVGIRHITASSFHPQSNGKIERYHRTLKVEINQVLHDMLYDKYWRYHEGLGNIITPYDVYTSRHHEIIQRRKGVKSRTSATRRDYNRSARIQSTGP